MDLSSMMAEAAEELASSIAPSQDDLLKISNLAVKQEDLEQMILDAEARVADLKGRYAYVSEVELPKAMEAVGMASFKLSNGSSISIEKHLFCGITEENQPKAFGWLEKTGNEGIIKNEFKLNFGKGQDVEAKKLTDILNENGLSFAQKRAVHWQTLKAFVRRQLADSKPIPTDLFSIVEKNVATIKKPK